MDPPRKLLLLVNLGTPAAPTPDAVRRFLLEFLSDPGVIDIPSFLWQPILRKMVLRRRPDVVAELYASIWTDDGSPLEVGTRRMADGLRERSGGDFEVDWAYRYGERSIARAFERHVGPDTEVAVVPLYVHHTSSTSRSVVLEAERVARNRGVLEQVRNVLLPPDGEGFIAAFADRCRQAFERGGGAPDHLILSYHGIPTRYDRREKRRYSRDCRATTDALLRALDWNPDRATHCYQSRFGPEPWLKPATAEVIEKLGERGVGTVAVVTPGFLTDGLETLEEIGIQGAEAFQKAGGDTLLRVGAVEDHPDALDAILAAAAAQGDAVS